MYQYEKLADTCDAERQAKSRLCVAWPSQRPRRWEDGKANEMDGGGDRDGMEQVVMSPAPPPSPPLWLLQLRRRGLGSRNCRRHAPQQFCTVVPHLSFALHHPRARQDLVGKDVRSAPGRGRRRGWVSAGGINGVLLTCFFVPLSLPITPLPHFPWYAHVPHYNVIVLV